MADICVQRVLPIEETSAASSQISSPTILSLECKSYLTTDANAELFLLHTSSHISKYSKERSKNEDYIYEEE
jgi:hypothetical protein